jgi:hypothetical protein
MPESNTTALVMDEIKRIRDDVQARKSPMKTDWFAKTFDAILNLHERLLALESKR